MNFWYATHKSFAWKLVKGTTVSAFQIMLSINIFVNNIWQWECACTNIHTPHFRGTKLLVTATNARNLPFAVNVSAYHLSNSEGNNLYKAINKRGYLSMIICNH